MQVSFRTFLFYFLIIYLTIYLFIAVKDMKLTFQGKNFTLSVTAIDGTFTSLCLFAFSNEQKDWSFSIDSCWDIVEFSSLTLY